MAWILVPYPPRERPKASASALLPAAPNENRPHTREMDASRVQRLPDAVPAVFAAPMSAMHRLRPKADICRSPTIRPVFLNKRPCDKLPLLH